jgi:uncharacterized cupredoxin-like copper-binding protein
MRLRLRLAALTAAAAALGGFAAFAHGSAAGEPGAAHGPTREIQVVASDSDGRMRFAPARIEVARGEQVRFAIRNAGALTHEFVIGTKSENAEHARMMAAMPDMKHDDPNAVTIPAGGSASLIWRFTMAGAFEFACLIPGHYDLGMHGVVNVK